MMNSFNDDNVSNWNRERICDFLRTNGFDEDFEFQEFEDLVSIATAVKSTMEPAQEFSPIHQETTVETTLTENIGSESFAEMSQPVETSAAVETITYEPDDEQISLILAMCEATGCEFEDAQKALQDMNWNLSTAIASHFDQSDIAQQQAMEEQQQAERRSRSSSNMERSRSTSSLGGHASGDENSMGVTGNGLNVGTDPQHPWSFIQQQIHARAGQGSDDNNGFGSYFNNRLSSYDDDEDDDGSPRHVDEYDEEGIRRPDPVRNQRLVSGHHPHMIRDNSLARADDPSVEWIHEPPRQLSYPGSFQEVKTMCKDEKKWLLVNIQSHNEFSSHMLNRDTWSDETLESILRSSYIFWQRGHTSGEGQAFMRTYQMTEGDLPNISIIDCRTGSRLLTIKGFMSHDDLSILLMEFIEMNNLESTDAPMLRHIDTTKWKNHDNDMQSTGNISPVPVDDNSSYKYSGTATPMESQVNTSPTPTDVEDIIIDEPSAATAVVAPPSVICYGACPMEPAIQEDVVKVSIKLASGGKPYVRRFYRSNTVREIYALVDDIEAHGRRFDLLSSYPTASLSDKLDLTLDGATLAGSQIIMRWL